MAGLHPRSFPQVCAYLPQGGRPKSKDPLASFGSSIVKPAPEDLLESHLAAGGTDKSQEAVLAPQKGAWRARASFLLVFHCGMQWRACGSCGHKSLTCILTAQVPYLWRTGDWTWAGVRSHAAWGGSCRRIGGAGQGGPCWQAGQRSPPGACVKPRERSILTFTVILST